VLLVTGKVSGKAVLMRRSPGTDEGATPARAGLSWPRITTAFLIDVAVLEWPKHLPSAPQAVAW
jgi:hypothetical protein